MNLFKIYLSEIKTTILKHKKEINFSSEKDLEGIIVETPPEKFDFDFSSNAAMVLSKSVQGNPRSIAEKIKNILENKLKDFSEISIAGPGFLNFKLTNKAWIKIINDILKIKKKFGSNKKNKKFNIEFVSANPTGPLHAGGGRWGAYGDSLARIFRRCGYRTFTEYYVNDRGLQTELCGASLVARRDGTELPEDGYAGEYVTEWAREMPNGAKVS